MCDNQHVCVITDPGHSKDRRMMEKLPMRMRYMERTEWLNRLVLRLWPSEKYLC